MATDAAALAAQVDGWLTARTDRRPLLARRSRQRGAGTRPRHRPVARRTQRRVKLLAAATRQLYESLAEKGSFVVSGDPQRGGPRLRRDRCAQHDGRRGQRLHQGPRPGAARRRGQGRSTSRSTPTPDDVAGAVVDETLRRRRRRRDRPAGRGPSGHRTGGAPGPRRRPDARPRPRLGRRRHGRGRQHRVGHRRRPGTGGRRWHVPPPRPDPRAGPGRPRSGEVRQRPRRAQARARRPHRRSGAIGQRPC